MCQRFCRSGFKNRVSTPPRTRKTESLLKACNQRGAPKRAFGKKRPKLPQAHFATAVVSYYRSRRNTLCDKFISTEMKSAFILYRMFLLIYRFSRCSFLTEHLFAFLLSRIVETRSVTQSSLSSATRSLANSLVRSRLIAGVETDQAFRGRARRRLRIKNLGLPIGTR